MLMLLFLQLSWASLTVGCSAVPKYAQNQDFTDVTGVTPIYAHFHFHALHMPCCPHAEAIYGLLFAHVANMLCYPVLTSKPTVHEGICLAQLFILHKEGIFALHRCVSAT